MIRRRRKDRGLSREIFHGCKDGTGHDSGDNRRSEVGGVAGAGGKDRGRRGEGGQRSKSSRRYHSLCGSRTPLPLVIIFFFMNELNSLSSLFLPLAFISIFLFSYLFYLMFLI